jgi:membrane protease YdiL (CAAX protease family)
MDTILNFFNENFWATATVLASLTVALTAFLNSKINPNKVWKQIISWIVGIGFTVGGYYLGVVNMQEPVWLSMVCTGILVGLESNGIYSIKGIKPLVNGWFTTIANIPNAVEEEKK